MYTYLFLRQSPESGEEAKVLSTREWLNQSIRLRAVPQGNPAGLTATPHAPHGHLDVLRDHSGTSVGDASVSSEHPEGCGFACPVDPKQAKALIWMGGTGGRRRGGLI